MTTQEYIILLVILLIAGISLIFGIVNYSDNRQQDKLIFGTIDNIGGLIENETKQVEINKNTTDILWEYGHKIYNK